MCELLPSKSLSGLGVTLFSRCGLVRPSVCWSVLRRLETGKSCNGSLRFSNSFILKKKEITFNCVEDASPIYLTLFEIRVFHQHLIITSPVFFLVIFEGVEFVFVDFGQSASSVFVFLVGRRVFFWGSKHLYDKSISLSVALCL